MYMRNTIFLNSELPSRLRPVLSVKLRQVRGIVSAVVEEKKVTVYYMGRLDLRALQLFVRAFEEKYGRKKEAKNDDMDVATYRREAIISVGGFIAMNILRKVNPEFYGSILLFRRLFTLYIARRYIKNGILGLVKDHQANADTLTATAVAASVLAGKPESSLTLLALSNGAEMMTEYAAEKARRQISGLLKLDQRDVWLVENGHERKVPVESLKRGDLIAVHLGEKICVDGSVVSGNAAVNQASITGESNPAIKQEKSPVYAGSVIEAGDLVIRVEKVGADTSLAQIIHLVEEAQTRRAPVQNFADKMAKSPGSYLLHRRSHRLRGDQGLAARPQSLVHRLLVRPEIVDGNGHLGRHRRGSPQGNPHQGRQLHRKPGRYRHGRPRQNRDHHHGRPADRPH